MVFANDFKIPLPHDIEIINDLITRTDTVFVWPGERVTANAYVSIFWFLYLDGRWIGIILGSFFLGFFAFKAYKKFLINRNERTFALYCFWLNVLIFSLVRIQFTGVSFALGIMYTLLMYKIEYIK